MIKIEHLTPKGEWKPCNATVKRCRYKINISVEFNENDSLSAVSDFFPPLPQATVRQHYIPAMHMALFGDPNDKPSNLRDTLVRFLIEDDNGVKDLKNTKVSAVAYVNKLYEPYSAYENELEEIFADLEGKISPILRTLDSQPITSEGIRLSSHADYVLLYKYTRLLFYRNVSTLQMFDDAFKKLQKQAAARNGIKGEQDFVRTAQHRYKNYGEFVKANLTLNLTPQEIFIGEVEGFLPMNFGYPSMSLTKSKNTPTIVPISTKRFLFIENAVEANKKQAYVKAVFEDPKTDIKIEDFYIKNAVVEKLGWIVDPRFGESFKAVLKHRSKTNINYGLHHGYLGNGQIGNGNLMFGFSDDDRKTSNVPMNRAQRRTNKNR